MPTVPLLRRRADPPADPRPAIAEFWVWWDRFRPAAVAALDAVPGQLPDATAGEFEAAVARLHPGLDWQLGRGTAGARYDLVVSGGGRPELRSLAERWWLAAPSGDDTFDYHPARPRDAVAMGGSLTLEDVELPLSELVAGTHLDRQRRRLDLAVHSPVFPLLSDDARLQAAFLGLDAALGEDDVERFVGAVEVAVDAPLDGVPLSSLGPLVDGLRAGPDSWATLTGSSPDGDVVGLVRHPFARVDRPLADTHVAVSLGYPPAEGGLPADAGVGDRIEALERRALEALGGDGPHAVLVGHVSGQGRCLVHLYLDGLEVDPAVVEPLLADWSDGPARLNVSPDPAWREIGHLLR